MATQTIEKVYTNGHFVRDLVLSGLTGLLFAYLFYLGVPA